MCAVTGIALPETVRAMERCLAQVEFGRALLLADRAPDALPDAIEWRQVEPLSSHAVYSRFILRNLATHVETPYLLLVQWDGFVIDAAQWRAEFVDYDYVGAPWPQFDDDRTVGNGGFSLRSRRLLELTASADFVAGHPEDIAICRTNRDFLETAGIRFAPPHVAERFAFERGPPSRTFGFHGLFNFPLVLPSEELQPTVDSLPPTLLTGRDGADLILTLAARGHRGWAWRLAFRRRAHAPWSSGNIRFWAKLLNLSLRRRAAG
jgi:hypothetical protein